jgi:uncharacterized protein YegL
MLDCSESMAGPAIEEVSRGVDSLLANLRSNPQAIETVFLSVITFSRYAKQLTPLTEVLTFAAPKLSIRTGTAVGAALMLLNECLNREVVRTTAVTKGDYKPLVFLFTDGQPTDDWQGPADSLRKMNNPKIANIYAIGCGPDVDTGTLYRITDIVLQMPNLTPDAIRKAFVWLSASVQTASTRLVADASAGTFDMPSLPEGSLTIAPRSERMRDRTPRQVFLHARCRASGKPYLMRFARNAVSSRYEAIAAHPLDELEEGDDDCLPPISSSMLDGCPTCPYCENPVASVCPCGAIFCDRPGDNGPVSCPACRAQLSTGSGGEFNIQRSQG